ncbi:MAG: hypothetical protein PHY77_07060 [Desulfotomaculaceae bacterium]|nr:hypothetical protein [Desulfotomaculaceae bacterium]
MIIIKTNLLVLTVYSNSSSARSALEGLPLLIGESYRKIAEYLAGLGEQLAHAP